MPMCSKTFPRAALVLALTLCVLFTPALYAGEDTRKPEAAKPLEGPRADAIREFKEIVTRAAAQKAARPWLDCADFCLKHSLWEFYDDCLQKALAADPKNADLQRLLLHKQVGSEWLSEDEIFAREAKAQEAKGLVYYANQWVTPAQLEPVRAADRKQAGFDVEVRLQSPLGYVTVYSNESVDVTRRAAAICEAAGRAYWDFYKPVFNLKLPPPLTVYLFKDKATYDRIFAKVSKNPPLPPSVIGVYDGGSKVLFVRTDTALGGDSYLSTMSHEMVHAMDDRLAGILKNNTPHWMVEGRAEHIGTYARDGSVVIPGFVHLDGRNAAASVLATQMEGLNLKQFLQQSEKAGFDFSGYCLSFAFVHFLFHAENEKYAPAFRAFLAGKPGKYSTEIFEKTVGKIEDLEPAFKKYVKEVLLPGMAASQRMSLLKERLAATKDTQLNQQPIARPNSVPTTKYHGPPVIDASAQFQPDPGE